MSILFMGNIPKDRGGKQTSGLSIAVFETALSISRSFEGSVKIYATDLKENKSIDNLDILSVSNLSSIINLLKSPLLSLQILLILIKTYRTSLLSIFKELLKSVNFLNLCSKYNIKTVSLHGATTYHLINFLKKKKIEVYVTIHGVNSEDDCVHPLIAFQDKKMSESNFDGLIFVSNTSRNIWENLYGKKAQHFTVRNGIDLSKFSGVASSKKVKKDKITICSVGAISELKGQLRVLKALILSNRKDIRYVCCGVANSNILDKMLVLAKNSDIDFIYEGVLSQFQVIELLKNSDYMILPSKREGFGLSYLESVLIGTKIILPKEATIIKELPWIIDYSLLINDWSVESIYKQIMTLKPSKEFVKIEDNLKKNLSWNKSAELYNDIFNHIFEKRI